MRAPFSPAVLGLVLVVSLSMLSLTPLAYADPPDPTSILGFWDENDFDDVVGYVTSATGLLHAQVAAEHFPIAPRQSLTPPAFQAIAASIPRSAASPRSPPTP